MDTARILTITVICLPCTGETPEVMSVVAETDERSAVKEGEDVEYSLKARCIKCGHEVIVDIIQEEDDETEV